MTNIETEVKLNYDLDTCGTGRAGTLYAPLEVLEAVLGKAEGPVDDDKIHYCWVFETPHGVGTIYDYWWNGKNEWSIGAVENGVAQDILTYMSKKICDKINTILLSLKTSL